MHPIPGRFASACAPRLRAPGRRRARFLLALAQAQVRACLRQRPLPLPLPPALQVARLQERLCLRLLRSIALPRQAEGWRSYACASASAGRPALPSGDLPFAHEAPASEEERQRQRRALREALARRTEAQVARQPGRQAFLQALASASAEVNAFRALVRDNPEASLDPALLRDSARSLLAEAQVPASEEALAEAQAFLAETFAPVDLPLALPVSAFRRSGRPVRPAHWRLSYANAPGDLRPVTGRDLSFVLGRPDPGARHSACALSLAERPRLLKEEARALDQDAERLQALAIYACRTGIVERNPVTLAQAAECQRLRLPGEEASAFALRLTLAACQCAFLAKACRAKAHGMYEAGVKPAGKRLRPRDRKRQEEYRQRLLAIGAPGT